MASAKCRNANRGAAGSARCERHGNGKFARHTNRENLGGNRHRRVESASSENFARCSSCNQRGCQGCGGRGTFSPKGSKRMVLTSDLPSNANSGECFAQVYLPPEFETVSDRVLVKEAFERVEVIPAEYEWTEERILVKEASTELVAHPPQFEPQQQTIELNPGHSTWMKADAHQCSANTAGPAPQDVFCLVSEPPTTMTLQKEQLVKAASVEEVAVPAEYQTVRRQKLVRAASTRRVSVPAEYREVERTVMLSPGRIEWQRVSCNPEAFGKNARVMPVRDNNP
jgi:hypothetical protein